MYKNMNLVLAHLRKTAVYVQESLVPNLTGTIINFWSPVAKKFEGTIIGRAGLYLKNVAVDYGEVLADTVALSKREPRKVLFYTGVCGILASCSAFNPDESSFRDEVVSWQLKMMLVGEPIRRRESEKKLKSIETWYNEGRLRFISLGILSFTWLDEYDRESAVYESQCKYLKTSWLSYPSRIVDVGFLGKWWLLGRYMVDYDINEEEFMQKTADGGNT